METRQHKAGCMANVACMVYHTDGICPGPYGKCTCLSIEKVPTSTQNPLNPGTGAHLNSPNPMKDIQETNNEVAWEKYCKCPRDVNNVRWHTDACLGYSVKHTRTAALREALEIVKQVKERDFNHSYSATKYIGEGIEALIRN